MIPLRATRRGLLGAMAAVLPSFGTREARAQNALGAVAPAGGAEGQVSLSAFGFRGDGVADDTAAWRRAIAFAGAHRIRTITVPPGVSLVASPIVDLAHPLPPGLTFVGAGAASDSPYAVHNRLKYTGSGVCWDVAYPTGAPAATGRWAWEAMTFECADPAGTMFSFGDPATHVPHDDPALDPYRVVQGIAFRGTMAFGGRGTGDFLRACKTFEIDVDAASSVYGFRRGFWLKGCDNGEIRCRMAGNNRAVMIERAGAFGNNNRIDIHYVGGPDARFGGEPSYSIWDTGNATTIGRGMLLEGTALDAHLYLGGYGTGIWSPILGAGAPFFRLAPEAREIALYSPRCPVIDPRNVPLIDPPADPNFGDAQADHRIRIVDAPRSIRAILPEHPRILLPDDAASAGSAANGATSLVVGPEGPQPRSHFCTPFNYWGMRGSPGGGGIKGFVRDPAIGGRWVIHLTKDRPVEQGITLSLVVGVDLQPGRYRLVNRMRLANGADRTGWALIACYDGAFLSNAFTFATGATYTTHSDPLDLSAAARGRTVTINLYNASAGKAGVDLFVEALGMVAVADAGWTGI